MEAVQNVLELNFINLSVSENSEFDTSFIKNITEQLVILLSTTKDRIGYHKLWLSIPHNQTKPCLHSHLQAFVILIIKKNIFCSKRTEYF